MDLYNQIRRCIIRCIVFTVTILLYTYHLFIRSSAYAMEQNSTAIESNESTMGGETVEPELLHQLEDPTTLSRIRRSIINAPSRQNRDGSPRYRQDAKGVQRRIYK
ncbi:hypothetical protein TSAR_007871 [Trichomalopsis sarcophagae]|uniref:Uncharacterized protein n=1 Tax=Trichomalopsis sarcophagae TaxID=543379 RepID=A0A232FG78_9HYME|nr:hypothetical protein TSAR_007871 [Trichomalopsis sarcophagae]